jgi:threonine synthase
MWRYVPWLPLHAGETPVSLGEGLTPLIEAPALARAVGVRRLRIKDESRNPTGSFKARGMSAAITRAKHDGMPGLVVPTAGNAGAAIAAYAAAAGLPVRVFAPRTTPRPILETIDALGAHLERVEGHIGDAGKLAAAFAAESGWWPVATLREPYRVEGMKTMGYELAEQCGWRCPTWSCIRRAVVRDRRHLEGHRRTAFRRVVAGGCATAAIRGRASGRLCAHSPSVHRRRRQGGRMGGSGDVRQWASRAGSIW